jgi:hypothetical protein
MQGSKRTIASLQKSAVLRDVVSPTGCSKRICGWDLNGLGTTYISYTGAGTASNALVVKDTAREGGKRSVGDDSPAPRRRPRRTGHRPPTPQRGLMRPGFDPKGRAYIISCNRFAR